MRDTELTPPEQRVLGCLLEKRYTTPDQYPLSLNSLRLACNQATNRNPVTDYDEATVREAAQRLCKRGLARLVSGHTSRTVKYRHLAEEALELDRRQLAVLAVLLLRGPQTPGELKGRSERMAQLASLAEVEEVIRGLEEREFARRAARRPGQKEDRFEHLLGEETSASGASEANATIVHDHLASADAAPASGPPFGGAGAAASGPDPHALGTFTPPAAGLAGAPAGPSDADTGTAQRVGDLSERVGALEAQLAELREQVAALRAAAPEAGLRGAP